MKTLIKIDRDSIKRNPTAFSTMSYYVTGRFITVSFDGEVPEEILDTFHLQGSDGVHKSGILSVELTDDIVESIVRKVRNFKYNMTVKRSAVRHTFHSRNIYFRILILKYCVSTVNIRYYTVKSYMILMIVATIIILYVLIATVKNRSGL